MFNCRLGHLPMVYLGVPMSYYKLSLEQFVSLIQSLTVKLDPWQGRTMSPGARLTWSNACLDNIPMFQMGLYLLGAGTHVEMDLVRGRFFWESCGQAFKYHMMKWEGVCRPKESGGACTH
jgi:hypothetical protein